MIEQKENDKYAQALGAKEKCQCFKKNAVGRNEKVWGTCFRQQQSKFIIFDYIVETAYSDQPIIWIKKPGIESFLYKGCLNNLLTVFILGLFIHETYEKNIKTA